MSCITPEHHVSQYIRGYKLLANVPWDSVDNIIIPMNVNIDWYREAAYIDKSLSEPLDDCGMFVCAFTEYVSHGLFDISSRLFGVVNHRLRYGAVLWDYARQKQNDGAISESEATENVTSKHGEPNVSSFCDNNVQLEIVDTLVDPPSVEAIVASDSTLSYGSHEDQLVCENGDVEHVGRLTKDDPLVIFVVDHERHCCSSFTGAQSPAPPMGHCWTKVSQENNDVPPTLELDGENVCLVKSMEKWEEKMSEANNSGKIEVTSSSRGNSLWQKCKAVVNFSASWCNPCRAAAPGFNELAHKYTSTIFLTVDVDELAELSTSWDIKATPTFIFFRDGRQVDKLVGGEKQELQKKLMNLTESTRSPG
ncbi:putative thioredoxin H10 [Capsicum annuum]|nr:putative thioredoxin H10 [Capsicum annuum]